MGISERLRGFACVKQIRTSREMCFPCFSLVNASRESRATATTTTSNIIFPNVFLLAPISLDLRSLPRPHSTTRDPDPNVCFEIIRPMEDLFKKTGSKPNLVELIEELDLLRWRIDNHHMILQKVPPFETNSSHLKHGSVWFRWVSFWVSAS